MRHRASSGLENCLAGSLLLCCFAQPGPLLAQDADSAPVDVEAGPVAVTTAGAPAGQETMEVRELSRAIGNLTLYPILNIGGGYRSDVYDADGDNGGSAFVNLRAGGGVQGENRGHLYGAEYVAQQLWYLDSDADNDDEIIQRGVAYWGTALDVRHNLDLGVDYLDSYDPRGQDDPIRGSRDTTHQEDPDNWTQLAYGANYVYGAPGARGYLELGTCSTCLEYDDNDQQYRDRDILDLGATLGMRMSGRTDGFVQVVYSDFDYRNATPDDPARGRSLDSEEWRYMVGASWEASERFTGVGRVGQVHKDFDDSLHGRGSNYRELTWDVVASWTPTDRNLVSLGYFRSPREPLVWEADELVDEFIEVEEVSLDVSHHLTSRIYLNAGGYRGWDNWKPSGRRDDLWGATAGLRFNLSRWGSVGVNYFHRERDSNSPSHDYSDGGILLDFNIGTLFGFGDSRAPAICLLRYFSPGTGYNGLTGY